LDEYQNDNFVLKSENNRLNSELSTYKIKNKENESLFNQISELKTQKFNLEKKVQDILTLETTSTKTSDIREKIEIRQQESNIQNLNNIIIDKTTRIGELEDKFNKLHDENNKLKMDLTSNSVR
jgi:predicted RNase H-like nuclease (RuvC/YqgF family)